MLRTFHVQNFKCLRDVTVELGPFTVLIGPNDSGKTSILDALRLIGRTFAEPWTEVFSGANSHETLSWMRESQPIRWKLAFGDNQGAFVYEWAYPTLEERGRSRSGDLIQREGAQDAAMLVDGVRHINLSKWPDGTVLRAVLQDSRWEKLALRKQVVPFARMLSLLPRYRLDPDALRSSAVPQRGAVLTPSGDNLVAVLDRLVSGPDRRAIVELEQRLHEAIPTLRGIALPTVDDKTGAKGLEFVLDGPGKSFVTIPCEHASDGAMLLTAFLALAFSDEPGMLLIEEPENGLHPSRLQSVVEMLRKISAGEVGRQPRQVILTTHSPLLLNYTRPEEVRIVRRDPDKGTQVTPMTAVPDIHKLLEEFGVGELWYLLGEQGLVEGKTP